MRPATTPSQPPAAPQSTSTTFQEIPSREPCATCTTLDRRGVRRDQQRRAQRSPRAGPERLVGGESDCGKGDDAVCLTQQRVEQ